MKADDNRRHAAREQDVPTGHRRVGRLTLAFLVFCSGLIFVSSGPPIEAASIPDSSTNTIIESGAYIIDMGVQPQTYENALYAYGLIYTLMIEHLIPVEWIIDNDKTADGSGGSTDIDFSYNGKDYRGAPFIIRAEYAELAAPVLAEWGGPDGIILADSLDRSAGDAGVFIDGPTTAPIAVDVFDTLTNWPNAILDAKNGGIAQGYFEAAFIPQVVTSAVTGDDKIAYQFKDPALLNSCDDVYVMPHADPEWATHQNLVRFNDEGGFIWAACHAVSVLENVADPADPNPDPEMNFLSSSGLIDFGDHDGGTPPYTYATDGTDPIMQFIGTTEAAQQNGSEQIYLPAPGSSWNPGAKVLVWDPDHPDLAAVGGESPGEASAIIYGRGFDDPTNGLVMYEGGHSHDKGDADSVSAIRAFFNLHLLAGIERGLDVEADVPDTVVAEETVTLNATISGGSPNYEYEWISSCGGTFAPVAPQPPQYGPSEGITSDGTVSTFFTAPAGAQDCQFRISAGDLCGRTSFDVGLTQIVERADLQIDKTDSQVSVSSGDENTYTLTVTNNGPNDATDVVVTDTWPADQVAFIRSETSQGSCSYGGGTVTCDLGNLAAGASTTVDLIGVVRSGATGVISNTATVTAPQLDEFPDNNTDDDDTTISGLRLAKTADPSAIDVVSAPGGSVDVTFTFEVSNAGPDALSMVSISDPDVPSCQPTYDSGDDGDGVLQVGEIWFFSCVAPVSGDLVNTATASAFTPAGDPVGATDSATVDAIAPGIDIAKGVDGKQHSDGADVVFEVVVTNSGDTDLTDVVVTDLAAPSCDRFLGDLAIGESISYSCSISPAPVAGTSDVNTIEVVADDPGGTSVTDTDDAPYGVVDRDLDITKVPIDCVTDAVLVDPEFYPGDRVCYRIVVTNSGSTTQTDVVLTDDLPPGLVHESTTAIAPITLIDDNFDFDVENDAIYQQPWTEFNDNDQAKDGDVSIINDADCPQGPVGDRQCVIVKNGDKGLQWETDLTGSATIDVAYQYTIIKNDDAGQFFLGCWTGSGWNRLDTISYPNKDVLTVPSGPFTVSFEDLALPVPCQIAGGRVGVIADVEIGTDPKQNTNNEILIDDITFVSSSDSIIDDFDNYTSDSYFSTGITPGWAEYNDDDPAKRFGGDVLIQSETTAGDKCEIVGDCAVAVTNKDVGLVWPADYSGFGECTIAFEYRIIKIKDGTGTIAIGGTNASGVWVTAASLPMPATTGWLASTTTITASAFPALFDAASRLGVSTADNDQGDDNFQVDDVKISCLSTITTANHPTIISAADGIDLAPGAGIDAKVTTTMTTDGGPFPRELVNVAATSSEQQPDPSEAAATVERVIADITLDKTVDPAVTNSVTPVTYTFLVTNSGNDPLENVSITDADVPSCAPVLDSGDDNGDSVLDLAETWSYSCTVTVDASFTNIANVLADPTTPGSGESTPATDADDASVEVVDAGIQIVKSSSAAIIRPNEPVLYRYDVTLEPGTTESLVGVSVNDDQCAPVNGPTSGDDGDDVLEDGETWVYTCSSSLSATTTNVAVTSGTDRIGTTHTDSDTVTVTVIEPAIQVDKTATPDTIDPGDTVTYAFDVTNPGNDPLGNVTITDDQCSPIVPAAGDPNQGDVNNDGFLDPGENWTYTCLAAVDADLTNVVEVAGTDSLGKQVDDFDSAVVNVLDPSIAVGKLADRRLIFPDETVVYTITVFNDGDTDFTSVTPADDTCAPLDGPTNDTGVIGTLEPGEGWFYTCVTTLDVTTTNTVAVDASGPEGVASDRASARVRVHDPLLDITKTPSETLVPPGTPVTYTYTSTNVSICDAADSICQLDHEIVNPIVTDDQCSPVDYVSGDLERDGRMSIGETWNFQCSAVLDVTTTNIATATGLNPNGVPIPQVPPTATATVEVENAELSIDKPAPVNSDEDGSGDVPRGDTLTYTITASITGTGSLDNVVITDPLLTVTGGTSPCANVAAGSTCTLVGTYVVTDSDVANGRIDNTATADSDQTDPVTDDETVLVPSPALGIDKPPPQNDDADGSGDVTEGDTLTYTITATNIGTANLTDVVVSDDTITPTGGTTPCTLVTPGATCTLIGTYLVTDVDVLVGSIVNVATADADQVDPVTDTVTVAVQTVGLGIVKPAPTNDDADGSGDVSEGDTLTYTITATNTGTSNLTNVVVADDTITPTGGTTPCDLASGETCTLIGTYLVTAADVSNRAIVNVATADSDQTGTVTDTVIVPLNTPDLSIDKPAPVNDDADGSGDVSVGDTLTYTITASNTGEANLTDVIVSDDKITPLGGTTPCSLVAPGATCTLIGSYLVSAADVSSGRILNTAAADSDQTGPVTDGETVVVPNPALSVDKPAPVNDDADGSGDVSVGDTLTYTITASNTGTANLTNVVLSDDKITSTGGTTPCDLAPGETCTLVGTYLVSAADNAAGSIVNVATADSDQTDPVDDMFTVVVRNPLLVVDKPAPVNDDADGSGDVSFGDTLTYTITATNLGAANLTNVIVSDDKITPTGGTTPCVLLAPGATCTLVGTYLVGAADLSAGRIDNVATADSDQTDPATDDETVVVPTPALTVAKPAPVNDDADGSGDVSAGDTLTYTITASNIGSATLTNVVVSDDRITATGGTTPCAVLAPGEICTLIGTSLVTAADVTAREIVNTATGDSDQTEPVMADQTTAVPVPRLAVDKPAPVNDDADGSGDVSEGDTLTYTITATNTGTATLTNVVVADDLITPTGGTTPCVLLAPGDSCTLVGTYVVTAADITAGTIDNIGTADSDQTDPVTDDETVVVNPRELAIDKPTPTNGDQDGSRDVSAGDVLTYTITATNTGAANLTNVVITDDLITPTGGTSPCGLVPPGGRCTLVGTYVVTDLDVAAGSIVNVATADSDQTDPVTDDETVVLPLPALAVDKPAPTNADEDGSGDVSAGDTLTYTITATNTGTASLTDVVISDPMVSPTSTTCALVPAGDSCILVGTYTVTSGDVTAGSIDNTGTADSDQTPPVDDPESTPVPTPALIVDKPAPANADEDGSGDVSEGDTLTYTITATNTGSANLTDVVVSDPLVTPSSETCPLLAPTETCVLVGTYTVTAADIAAGSIVNVGTGDSDQTTPVEDPETTPVPTPGLTIDKPAPTNDDADGSGDVSEGDTLTYVITATNTGTSNLTNVVVADDTITPTGGTTPCDVVSPGQTCTLVGTYLVTAADATAGEVVNVATANSAQTEPVTDTVTVPLPKASLVVDKPAPVNADEDGSFDVSGGDTLTYTITATNNGSSNLTNVVVSDSLITPMSTTCPLVAPGATCVLVGTYVVSGTDVAAGSILNTATAESDQTDPVTDDEMVPVRAPSLRVDKPAPSNGDQDGSRDVSAGDVLTYTITATNDGATNLTDVVVTDDLITPTGGTSPCGLVPPGGQCTLVGTYVVTAADVDNGSIDNVGTADSDQTDPVTDDETVLLPAPAIEVDKSAPTNADEDGSGDVSLGDTLTYAVTATNTGTANLSKVIVSDQLLKPAFVQCPLLAPGETCVLTGSLIVSRVDIEAGQVANTGTADTDQTPPTEDEEITPVPTPDLSIDKPEPVNADEDGSGDVSVNDTLIYTITATNTGTANLTNVVVTDDKISPTGGTTPCQFVMPGETCILIGTYVVTAADIAAGTIVNVGTADSDQTGLVTDDEIIELPGPGFLLDKQPPVNADEDGSGDISVGDTLTYTVIGSNTGQTNLTNVVVSDPMLTPSSETCAFLPSGDDCVLVGTYVVTGLDLNAGSIDNVATADSDQTVPRADEENVTVPSPVLTIDKPAPVNSDEDGSGDVSVGDTLTYTITATNTGTANLTDVVVSDPMIVPTSVTCPLVMPGETCVLVGTHVVSDGDVATGSIDNIATGDSVQTEPVTDDETVAVLPPALIVDKPAPTSIDADGSGDVTIGDTLTYAITATNTGESNLTDVVVSDPLLTAVPGGTTPCALVPPGGSCTLIGTYVVTEADVAAGQVDNTATADSDQTDPVQDIETTPVFPSPEADLSIVKTGPTSVEAGDQIEYTLTVANAGPATAENVEVVDVLPSGTTFVSADPECRHSGGVVICSVAELANGASRAFGIIVVSPIVSGDKEIVNVATVESARPDPDPTDNESSSTTLVTLVTGELTGAVWNDIDADGVRDPGEEGIAGVTIVVTGDSDRDGVVETFTTVTDADGAFSFDLPPGEWEVEVDESTVPFGLSPSTAQSGSVTVVAGETVEIDFGEAGGTVTGAVWWDLDGDGVRDPDEVDLTGVILRMVCPGPDGIAGTADDMLFSSTTQSPFVFTPIPVGQECVVAVDESTLPRDVSTPTFDLDGILDGRTTIAVEKPGELLDGVDFGYTSMSELPETGRSTGPSLRFAALIVLAGIVLVLGARRRRGNISIR